MQLSLLGTAVSCIDSATDIPSAATFNFLSGKSLQMSLRVDCNICLDWYMLPHIVAVVGENKKSFMKFSLSDRIALRSIVLYCIAKMSF